MFVLGITDTLEAIASVADKVSYNVSYVDGTTVETTQGLVGSGQTTLHTAAATTRVLSVSMSNTHTSAITVTLSKDPTNAGTLYHYFETISLGVKYTLVFDGQRLTVMDASGAILSSFSGWDDGATTEILVGGGAGSAPVWTTATGSGAPVRAGAPTLTGQATIPTINLSGGQIAFPATAVPSADPNTLDDYEEGTCTLVLQFGGNSVDITYSLQTGLYTKIGRLVTVTGCLTLTDKGSSNGVARIGGLPFTSKDVNGAYSAVSLSYVSAISFADQIHGYIPKNESGFLLYETTNAGVPTAITDAEFTDTSAFIFCLSYFV